jgi:diguanylate cyclase (GGDEF)-like protein
LLKSHQFQVLEATNGAEGLKVLFENPEIRLVLTDFNMPVMDGVELIKRARPKFPKEKLAIIGLSAYGNNILSAQFIKNGANDFINKPFLEEEFFCRITQNLEIIEYIDALEIASTTDFLTGMTNRRHLFDLGGELIKKARKGQVRLGAVMIDIDHFKRINDTYGHDGGDAVLQQMAAILKGHFDKNDIVARMGGEEFCILLVDHDPQTVPDLLESLRATIEDYPFSCDSKMIRVTSSFGACLTFDGSLDAMISKSDEYLYAAKTGGRNRVVCPSSETSA